MKKQTKLALNGRSFARKATLLIGTFGLFAWMNSATAQCPPPTITPSGPVDLCTGGFVTLTATAGSSYLWSNGITTQSIVVSTAGSYVVTVDDGAGCIEASAATVVTKNSATPGGFTSVTGASKACPATSKVYTIAPVARAVYYVWNLPTGATIAGLSSYQTAATSVTVDFDAGFTAAGVIQIVAHNGCGTSSYNKNVGLDIPTTPASISGPTTTCAGVTYTFSTPIVANVLTYNWTAPAGSVITGQGTNQVNITFPIGYVTGSVGVSNSNTCGSSGVRALSTRSVPPKPQAITGATSGVCGSTQTYSIPPVTGALFYTWTPPVGSSVVAGQTTTSADILFIASLNNGYVRVVANNVCGAGGESKLRVDGEVVISTNPANVSDCAGNPASFSINAQGGGVSYQWQKDGINLTDGGTISGSDQATLSISSLVVGDAGNYRCIASNLCSAPDTSDAAALTVGETPANPGAISGNSVACPGSTGFAYSIAAVPGATNYVWTGFDGATIVTGQGTTNVTVDFGPTTTSGYTIKVTADNSCGASAEASAWIRRSISTPNFSTSTNTACPGSTNVPFAVNPVVGASSYTWTTPANTTIASGQGTDAVAIDFGPSFTSGQVCVTATNICVTTPQRCINVISTPAIPGAIGGQSTSLCNTSAVYNINNVYGATLYTWNAPTGATITSGQGTNTVNIDFGPSFTSGNVTVIAKNTCGDSPTRVRSVVAVPAKPAAITGNGAPCANSTGNAYSVPAVAGASSYVWTLPFGATIASGSGTNSVTVNFASAGGSIGVKAQNACGLSSSSNLAIAFSCRMQSSVSAEAAVSIYPNPASDRLFINHENSVRGEVIITITDVAGRNLMNEVVNVTDGNNVSEINIASLKSGVYLIETNSVYGKSVSRFIKD